MKIRTMVLVAAALALFVSVPTWADTYSYNVVTGSGITGTFATFTALGVPITAYGYMGASAADLFFKTNGGSETGLGMAAMTNHEIMGNGFVQFDITSLLVVHPSSLTFKLGSVSAGESYAIWGSNTLGTAGVLLASGGPGMLNVSVPGFASYKFISISAPTGNVLIDGVTAVTGVPEPGSSSLLITGLMSVFAAGMFFRKGVILGLRDRIAF